MKEYEIHEAAGVIPQMGESEFGALKEDIRKNGVHMPILLHEDKILDGGTRYRICQELGIEPQFLEWDGKGDPVEVVLSANLHRRHLTESGRAMVGARCMAHFEKAAKERQGARTDLSANLRESEKGKASEDAARVVTVSSRSVESAKKVLTLGIPELVTQVDSGAIRLGQASRIAALSAEEQARLVAMSKAERSQALSQQNGRKSPKPDAESTTLDKDESLPGQWEAAVASMLKLIEEAKASEWSGLSLEIVSEGLERINAVMSQTGAVSSDAFASADDYAGTDPGQADEAASESAVVVPSEEDPPGEAELAENLALDDASTSGSDAATVSQAETVMENSLGERPTCFGRPSRAKVQCTKGKPCRHGAECEKAWTEARAKRLPRWPRGVESNAEPKESFGQSTI